MSTSVTILTGPPAAPPPPAAVSLAQERVASIFDPASARANVRLASPVEALEAMLADEGDWQRLARIEPAHPIPRETFQRSDVPAQMWEGEYKAIAISGRTWHPPVSVFPGFATIAVYQSADSHSDGLPDDHTLLAVPLVPVLARVNFEHGVRMFQTWHTMSVDQKILILRDGLRDALAASTAAGLLRRLGETCREAPSEFHDVWRGRSVALIAALAPLLGPDAAAHRSMAGLGAYG